MKIQQSLILIAFLSGILFFQNCSNKIFVSENENDGASVDGAPVNPVSIDPLPPSEEPKEKLAIASLKYFRGGWFGPFPNWAFDMELLYMKNGTIKVYSKDKSESKLCEKMPLTLTVQQKEEFEKLANELVFEEVSSQGPFMADGGVHQITINFLNGQTQTASLAARANRPVELMARNGNALVQFLQQLDTEFVSACF